MTDTRVIALMFHRVNDPATGYEPHLFEQYLAYLTHHFPIVIPGDPLPKTKLAICLTFDDAYFDFYHTVFPLLQKYDLRALLGVPVKYIVEKTELPAALRLSVPYAYNFEDATLQAKVPLCTWTELREMVQSQQVVVASHGFRHANLEQKNINLQEEIRLSQKILQEKLNCRIHHFVYPFGKMNHSAHRLVCAHYRFAIRIGSALNHGWKHRQQFIYRINADPLWKNIKLIDQKLIAKLNRKYWINRIRFK